MNILKDRNFNPDTIEGEYNLVHLWTHPRPWRIVAGVLGGAFAGIMMLAFGMIFCAVKGIDIMAPMKISAIPFLGGAAMEYGSASGLAVGLLAFFTLTSVLGGFYAYFTGVNNRMALLGTGFTWGAFSWVFITDLFMPSFRAYYVAKIPSGTMFFAWMVFGFFFSVGCLV